MQERNLTALLSEDFTKPFSTREQVSEKLNALAIKNTNELSAKTMPDFCRTPTAKELGEIREWAINYKKNNKGLSKRQLRKATQEHFNIRIFR